jgi:hypothetical protein
MREHTTSGLDGNGNGLNGQPCPTVDRTNAVMAEPIEQMNAEWEAASLPR